MRWEGVGGGGRRFQGNLQESWKLIEALLFRLMECLDMMEDYFPLRRRRAAETQGKTADSEEWLMTTAALILIVSKKDCHFEEWLYNDAARSKSKRFRLTFLLKKKK